MNILIITKNGNRECFTDLDMISDRKDIKLLEINYYKHKNIIINSGVETLIIKKSNLTEFPDISKCYNTIRVINIITSKIEQIPNLTKCIALEELTVEDAYINEIKHPFPNELRNLNLSYNQILDSFFNELNVFPNEIVSINISHNFITVVPPNEIRNKVNYECNNIEEKKIFTVLINDVFQEGRNNIFLGNRPDYEPGYGIYNGVQGVGGNDEYNLNDQFREPFQQFNQYNQLLQRPNLNRPAVTMFSGGQTVHLTSINDSASKSIKNILDMVKDRPVNNKYLDEILYNFYGFYLFRICFYSISIYRLRNMIEDTSVHSVMRVTYGQLLERVWTLICNHPEKKNLIERLKTEIHDSFGYCFTGRINRLINSLSGFIDNIGITISPKEEIQNEVLLIVKRYGEEKITKEQALEEVNNLLKNRNDLDEAFKQSWINALEDY